MFLRPIPTEKRESTHKVLFEAPESCSPGHQPLNHMSQTLRGPSCGRVCLAAASRPGPRRPRAAVCSAAVLPARPAPTSSSRPASGVALLENATADDFRRTLSALAAQPQAHEQPAAQQPTTSATSATSPFVGTLRLLFEGGRGSGAHAEQPRCRRAMVVFSAHWCGPCKVLHSNLAKAVALLPPNARADVDVLIIDVEACPELASELGVRSLPTLLCLGPDTSRGPIVTQGVVSTSFLMDALSPGSRAEVFAGHNLEAAWLRL